MNNEKQQFATANTAGNTDELNGRQIVENVINNKNAVPTLSDAFYNGYMEGKRTVLTAIKQRGTTHLLKISEDYVKPILTGEKTFEVRRNDRGYQKGDKIKFVEVGRKEPHFSNYPNRLENKVYEITYVHSGLGMQNDYVILGIKEKETDAEDK